MRCAGTWIRSWRNALRSWAVLVCASAVVPPATTAAQSYEATFITYLGASQWERIQSVFVDADGYIYLGGTTKSSNLLTTPGAYDRKGSGNGDNDGFVAKLSPEGTRLVWSTYLHGSQRDDVYGVWADSQGFVYVTGWTGSADFPTTAGVYDRTHNGKNDVFLAKFTPDGSRLVYATLFGGSGVDQCRGGMAVDDAGRVYLSGYTDSLDLPLTRGAIQKTFQGGYGDAFVAQLSADGSSLLFSTYLGSSGPDHAFPGLCLHADGSIIITGVAGAADFPTTPNAFQKDFGGSNQDGIWYGDAFVARFSLTSTHECVLHYITFLGGSADEKSTAQHGLALDREGNAIVAGTTLSIDFPTTIGTLQPQASGHNNLVLSKLSLDGSRLLASTYFGGVVANGYEPSGIGVDSAGNVVVGGSIYGQVTGHPTTPNAFQQRPADEGDSFFAVLSADLSVLTYSSFFGGIGDDRIRDLWLGPQGSIVFGGDTYSPNLPIHPPVLQETYVGNGDAYVARFDALGMQGSNHDRP